VRLHLLNGRIEQLRQQLQVVDHHIQHHRDIRRTRAEGMQPVALHKAHRKGLLAQPAEGRVEALAVPDHQHGAGTGAQLHHVLRIGKAGGKRLLHQAVAPGVKAHAEQLRVRMRRCCQRDRLCGFERLLQRFKRRHPQFLGNGTRSVGHDIVDPDHLRRLALPPQPSVERAHMPDTDDGNPDARTHSAFG